MQTGRAAYDHTIKMTAIPSDEPTFLLRAQDTAAAPTVRAWASFAYVAGVPLAVVESALQQADAMEAWPIKKLPDADHLTGHEQQQLGYQLSRRSWSAAEDREQALHGPRILLAEERAYLSAMGKLRPILRTLFERGQWGLDGRFIYDPDWGPRRDGRPAGTPDDDLPREPCAIKQLMAAAFILRQPGEIDDRPLLPEIQQTLTAAMHALRSYEHGNAAPDLAKSVADDCARVLTQLEGAA